MGEIERLEIGPGPRRRWPWVVVVVVVALVTVFGAFRAVRADHLTPPLEPSPMPSLDREDIVAWPADLGAGTLYVVDDTGLAVIDVSSGRLQRADRLGPGQSLTRVRDGVLQWSRGGQPAPRLVIGRGSQTAPVTGALGAADRYQPGPGGAVWSRSKTRTADGSHTWQLVDDHSGVRRSSALQGVVISDGSAGLFNLYRDQVRHVTARSDSRWTGGVSAVGPDGFVVSRCFAAGCTVVLHDQTNGQETPVRTASLDQVYRGLLAPGNGLVATPVPVTTSDSSPTVIQVTETLSGRRIGSFAGNDGGGSLTWLSSRWLAVSRADGLVLYDSATGARFTPDLPLRNPGQLAAQTR